MIDVSKAKIQHEEILPHRPTARGARCTVKIGSFTEWEKHEGPPYKLEEMLHRMLHRYIYGDFCQKLCALRVEIMRILPANFEANQQQRKALDMHSELLRMVEYKGETECQS